MKVTQITHQAINPAVVTIDTSQPNAVDAVVPSVMYASAPKSELTATQTCGTPHRLTHRKTRGAKPSRARPYIVLEARNVQLFPELKAEVRMTALMIDGKTLTPAASKAMTNGEAAVPEFLVSASELAGTTMPMMRTERI